MREDPDNRISLAHAVTRTLVATLVLVAVAATAAPAPVPRLGGTLRTVLSADPPTLDPALVTDLTSAAVARQLFDSLVELDESLVPVPALAHRWTVSADRLVYTFFLHSGVRFHNGRALVAADVKYSFERAARGNRPWVFEKIVGAREFIDKRAKEIAGIRVSDPATVEIRLARPFAPFIYLVAYDAAAVVPREDAERLGAGFATRPVGTGAFRLASWRHDDQLVLERFPGHFRGPAHLERIVYRVLPEDLTKLNEYRAGQLDLSSIPASYCRIAQDDPGLRGDVAMWPTLGTQAVRFNVERAPFTDVRVRRALAHTIDAAQVVKTVLYGCGAPAESILPPGLPGFSPAVQRLRPDRALARKLLGEAGFPDGRGLPTLTFHFNTATANQRLAELLQAQFREIGLTLELRRLDWAAHLAVVDAGDAGFFRQGWVADYPDPENFLAVLFHSKNAGAAGNTSWYRDATVDRWLDEADVLPPGPERNRLYQAAEQRVIDEAVYVPLFYFTSRALIRPYVKGLDRSPLSSAPEFLSPLRKVWLDR